MAIRFRTNILTTGTLESASLNATDLSVTKLVSTSSKFGAKGDSLTNLVSGVLTVTSPALAACSATVTSLTAHTGFANVNAGDMVFVQAGSVKNGLGIMSASATAASVISILWGTLSPCAVTQDAAVSMQYLAIRK